MRELFLLEAEKPTTYCFQSPRRPDLPRTVLRRGTPAPTSRSERLKRKAARRNRRANRR